MVIENLETHWVTDYDAYEANFTYNGVPCRVCLDGRALSASPIAILNAVITEVAAVIKEAMEFSA